jgi:dinuclear metal center YbgI/SA1388 family protein
MPTEKDVEGCPMHRDELLRHLDATLEAPRFKDYCPNGLQVEGAAEVGRVVCGVSASLALIEAAIAAGADALLVHHGWFWRGEEPCLLGMRRRRMAALLAHDLNLFAYHLPLDAHPTLGNNAGLARACGWRAEGRFLDQDIGWYGSGADATVAALAGRLATVLGREPLVVGNRERPLRRIAWCTGAAQDGIEDAVRIGADAFVSGEISERTVLAAREYDVAYLAAGHHATERFGVMALAALLREQLGLDARFVDIDNPA